MSERFLCVQALLGVCVFSILLGSPAVARADDNKAQCVDAYEQGQRARKQSALLRAKDAFLLCSSDLCPAAMHADCQGWLDEVDAAIPKTAFEVTSKTGAPLSGVMISIDLGPARPLEAQPIALDPGAHVLTFTLAGYRELRESVVLTKRDSVTRHVALEPLSSQPLPTIPPPTQSLATQPAVPPPAPRRAVQSTPSGATTWPAWVGVGIGAAGLAGFSYFGLHARSEDRALDSCANTCDLARVDAIRRDYLIANVSIGVGAAALIGAGAWILLAPRAEPSKTASAVIELQVGPITSLRHAF